jgi:large subunit ribosomal protein L4
MMPQLELKNTDGKQVGTIELMDTVFGVEPNHDVMFRCVHMQLANRRAGTASTKTRSEVRGGGRKPWAQKHTGRARFGSSRNPIWRHGGVAHGPRPKDWSYSINKKMKKLALKSALSIRCAENAMIVVDDFRIDEPKTRRLTDILKNLGIKSGEKILIVVPAEDDKYEGVRRSGKNLKKVKVLRAGNGNAETPGIDGLNVFDILNHEKLVTTADIVQRIEEVLG